MKLVVKVTPSLAARATEIVSRRVGATLGSSTSKKLTITPVFPGVTTGRRAGMVTVSVGDDVAPAEVERLISALRSDESLEYADVPSERRPSSR